MRSNQAVCIACVLAVCTAAASADTVPANVVIKEGDVFGPRAVDTLNAPFTNGTGQVGFVAAFDDSTRGIYYDTGFIFNSSDALPDTLTGGEGTMGIGNNQEFIYSPSFNGSDAVYTHNGVLAKHSDPAPGIAGQFLTFASRPRMQNDGSTSFVSGLNPTQGSTSTINRVFYRGDSAGNLTPTLISGTTVVDGLTLATGSSIDFDYDVSGNGAHHAHVLDMDTGSTANDIHVYLDGSLIHQEGTATGGPLADNWQNFDAVGVNDSGDYVFTGDTDAATTSDEFVAVNGAIAVQENMNIDGISLSGRSILAASINNQGLVAHAWGSGSNETLFVGDMVDLENTSIALLSNGDDIDIDNDLVPDFTITDFNASLVIGPGLDLGHGAYVYLEVDMVPFGGGTAVEAIIGVRVPEPGTAGLLGLGLLALLRRRR